MPLRIILVEDDEVDIEAVRRAASKNGLTNPIETFRNGRLALDYLREFVKNGDPYLVLLDMNMPQMNGVEFLLEIRNDPLLKKSVVFVLSTSESEDDLKAAYGFNVAGYIFKSRLRDGFENLVRIIKHYEKHLEFPTLSDSSV